MNYLEKLEALCRDIDARQPSLRIAKQYHDGTQALSFLSPIARKQLGDRLTHISIGYPRLATDSVAERMTLTGFVRNGEPLSAVWSAFARSGSATLADDAIHTALKLGRAHIVVWAHDSGLPLATVERDMATERDPITHRVVWAAKKWRRPDDSTRAVLYGPDAVRVYIGPSVASGGVVPNSGWSLLETLPNPLGVCPVVELVNAHDPWDTAGQPESAPIWSLTDLLCKTFSDIAVSSESSAMPRRWASGLQLQFDAEGNLVAPFDNSPGAVWLSESGDTKFGGFPEPKLEAYSALTESILRQIGALSGLPDHLIGVHSADPSSAEMQRSAEQSLSARATKKTARFGASFGQVASLMEAIMANGPVRDDISATWKSTEVRGFAAQADGVTKLYQSGLLPWESAMAELGYSPDQITSMRQARIREQLDRSPIPALPAVTEEPDDAEG